MYKFQIDKQYKLELTKSDQTKKLKLSVADCQKGDKLCFFTSNPDQLLATPANLELQEDSCESVRLSLRF